MNLLLLKPSDFDDRNTGLSHVTLSDQRLKHVLEVHQAQVGDTIKVGLLDGKMGQGVISALDQTHMVISQIVLDQSPPPALPCTVIMAMPRPKMLRRILRMCGEFGVKELYLINSYRVEKSYWQTPVLQKETIDSYLIQGLEQAKDTVLPQVHIKKRFKPFVEDELKAIIGNSRALVAHPNGGKSCPHQITAPTTLVIGPEGGFIPYEVDMLIQHGCEQIHLGERIYRVENALPVLLSKLYD